MSRRRRATTRQKNRRYEPAVIKQVRAACVARDGLCRVDTRMRAIGITCEGPSEWAHLGPWRRSKTVGQAPTLRHHTMGSLMLCAFHHRLYDAHRLEIEGTTTGADGPLTFTYGGAVYQESGR